MEARNLDIWQLWPFVSATIIGNAVSFAFFMAALKCSKLQKTGVKDDELPWLVYLGLICAPAVMGGGIFLLR
jgi:hypothetical protein